jgi:hypothetical protein
MREPFLSAGHVLYMAEGGAVLESFAVVLCQPVLMWLAALLTSAVPWLLLDPLLMPISYSKLRWVQLASVAVLLPTNALRWARSRCPALRWVPGDRQHGVSCSCWVGTTCSCSRLDYNSCRLSVCTFLGAA